MKLYLSVTIALLAASPVLAQNNATAPTSGVEATAANDAAANASDNVAAAPKANDATAVPADTTAALPPSEPPAQPQPRSFPWGVLGLIGLIGLLGGRKSAS
jgi:hypothetical protein